MSLDSCFPISFSGLQYITTTVHFEAQVVPDLAGGSLFKVASVSFDIFISTSVLISISIYAERPRDAHIYKRTYICIFSIPVYIQNMEFMPTSSFQSSVTRFILSLFLFHICIFLL